jgi:ribosomal protein S18 acetylase RimI-like enzyme
MVSSSPVPGTDSSALVVEQLSAGQWEISDGDQVIGRGESWLRLDGRRFISVDSWDDAAYDPLLGAMLAQLPRPIFTIVDEAEAGTAAHWQRAGFTVRRREWRFLLPTDPQTTGLDPALAPAGVTILPVGAPEAAPLQELGRVIRQEIEAEIGWQEMPAEVLPRPEGAAQVDPTRPIVPDKHGAAVQDGAYVGLIRVTGHRRLPRIGLVAVRADHRRRGIARALLARALGDLHASGTAAASAEAGEANEAALALLAGVGAQRQSSSLEWELS